MKIPVVLALSLLLGCGQNVSPLVKVARKTVEGIQHQDTYGQKLGSLSPIALEKFNFPVMYVGMTAARHETVMRAMESNQGIETWVGESGTSLSIADGIVLSTRGYGHDLASSRRPTLGELKHYATTSERYKVLYRHWDFEGNLLTRVAHCEASETTAGVEERCSLHSIQFTNTYELNPVEVKSSRQWISPQLGYLHTIRLK